MTTTSEISTTTSNLAALSLTLRPCPPSADSIFLTDWLSNIPDRPFWITLAPIQGVYRVMPILPHPRIYPDLLQNICQKISQSAQIEWEGRHYTVMGVETESNTLFAIQLTFTPQGKLPSNVSRALHSFCLQWFANADPELAAILHTANRVPFTISHIFTSNQQLQVRFTVFKKELLTALLWGIASDLGQIIHLSGVPCRLQPQVKFLNSITFEQLFQIPVMEAIELEFLTPTSFKQESIIQTFPLPEMVFNGLRRRWNQSAPEALHFPETPWQAVVSAYDLHTQVMKMQAEEIGTVGWIRYRFFDPDQAKAATVLSHFAIFSGVGRKTTMGMGMVKLKTKSNEIRKK